ncbi:hypothetical protein AB1N83_014098 [Pleurotus pulmonarius]
MRLDVALALGDCPGQHSVPWFIRATQVILFGAGRYLLQVEGSFHPPWFWRAIKSPSCLRAAFTGWVRHCSPCSLSWCMESGIPRLALHPPLTHSPPWWRFRCEDIDLPVAVLSIWQSKFTVVLAQQQRRNVLRSLCSLVYIMFVAV